ncbi:MAG: Clp protease ClpP [Desulfobacterium sp.]
MGKQYEYEIKNQTDDSADLMLYGIIGSYWDDNDAKEIVQAINNMDVSNINVSIYSNGGSVFAGLAIYNALRNHRAKINIFIDSLAASIASVIAMAGTVSMPRNAFLMIHNPWSYADGDAEAFRKMADTLAKIKDSLVSVYHAKTGIAVDEISTLMNDETWLTADEAMAKGFADIIDGEVDVSALVPETFMNSIQNFKNVPPQMRAILSNKKLSQSGQPTKDKEMNITLDSLKKDAPELLASIQKTAREEDHNEGLAAGAVTEQARIQAVFAQNLAGHDALIQTLAFDGKTTGPEAAMQVLAAEKAARNVAVNNLADDGIPPVAASAPPATPKAAAKEPKTEADFNANADLVEEFEDFETYDAYQQATQNGLVRVLKNKEA